MNQDQYLDQIELEVSKLQGALKTRLQETQDLSDLNRKVLNQSFKLDESTSHLKKTSIKTKWKWFFKYLKWIILIVVILSILFLSVFGKLIPSSRIV